MKKKRRPEIGGALAYIYGQLGSVPDDRIHPDNKASQRVAEKCGFTLEGTARGAWFHRGRHHDVLVYALLREEFDGGQRSESGAG